MTRALIAYALIALAVAAVCFAQVGGNSAVIDYRQHRPEDINRDGAVNAVDIQFVINAALGIGKEKP